MHPEVRQFSFNSSGFLRNLIMGGAWNGRGVEGQKTEI